MIEKLSNNILINDKIKSVYNFNEYSLQDLLSKFFEKINESIDISNNALDFLNYLKNEGLPREVIKGLQDMYNDGRLTQLIDNLSGDLSLKIESVDNELNNKIENITNIIIPNSEVDGGSL